MITLGEAARLTGLGKTTVARAIKAGRLSATRTAIGSYEIDPAELARCYPVNTATEATDATVAATGPVLWVHRTSAKPETTGATAALEAGGSRTVAIAGRGSPAAHHRPGGTQQETANRGSPRSPALVAPVGRTRGPEADHPARLHSAHARDYRRQAEINSVRFATASANLWGTGDATRRLTM